MNVFIYTLVLIYCFQASALEVLKRSGDFDLVGNGTEWDLEDGSEIDHEGHANAMNSTGYMSVNHYYCANENIEDPVMILYGTKSWTFPAQDVNLTLSYPTANSESEFISDGSDYIITGFKVVLYIDGMESKGYIVDGGIMKKSINLCFVSRNVTSLSYQFWLYGLSNHSLGFYTELSLRYYVCP